MGIWYDIHYLDLQQLAVKYDYPFEQLADLVIMGCTEEEIQLIIVSDINSSAVQAVKHYDLKPRKLELPPQIKWTT